MATVKYPLWANTREKKWLYCRRMVGLLRKLDNVMGDWFRDGITQAKYDKLPLKVRNRYPFTPGEKLSQVLWEDFQTYWVEFCSAISKKLGAIRKLAEDDNAPDVDIDRDFD